MLRVTVHDEMGSLRFKVEGRLAGALVQELKDCWQTTLAGQPRHEMCVDLTGVIFIDDAGKDLLAQLHRAGATLLASGVQMRAVVMQVTQAMVSTPGISSSGVWSRGLANPMVSNSTCGWL